MKETEYRTALVARAKSFPRYSVVAVISGVLAILSWQACAEVVQSEANAAPAVSQPVAQAQTDGTRTRRRVFRRISRQRGQSRTVVAAAAPANPATETVAEVKPETEGKAATEAKPETEAKPVAEAKPDAEKQPVVEAKPDVEKQPVAEVKPESETKPEATPEPAATPSESEVTVNKPIIGHSAAMTAIHNSLRAESGLAPQLIDPNLSQVAQQWAEHMASVGSMYHGGGEQIIAYSGGDTSYDAGFRTWLGSSPHRAWLCSSGNLCGFGYAIGRNGCAYYAGAFGQSVVEGDEEPSVFQTVSDNGSGRSRRLRRR